MLFQSLNKLMQDGDEFKLIIEKKSEDELIVVIQPCLKENTSKDEAIADAYGLLAMPMRLTGTAADLDNSFQGKVNGYGDARQPIRDAYDSLLDQLKEGGKKLKGTRAKQSAKEVTDKPTDAGKMEDKTTTPAPSASVSNAQSIL